MKQEGSPTSNIGKPAENGNVLVELGLVLTLLLGFAFATVQICQYLRVKQVATALSRELASIVYRECVADNSAFPAPRSGAWPAGSMRARFDPRACVPLVLTPEFQTRAERFAPGVSFHLSLYNYDGTTAYRDYPAPGAPIESEFSESAVRAELAMPPNSRSEFTNSLVDYSHLVVAEVRIPFFQIGPAFFRPSVSNTIYGVTVL